MTLLHPEPLEREALGTMRMLIQRNCFALQTPIVRTEYSLFQWIASGHGTMVGPE